MLIFDITTSLDGFVAGPNPSLEDPLGQGGMQLHDWATSTRAWRERHGVEGGEDNADSELIAEGLARQGAVIMGRRMFSGGSGPWETDPNRDGWWGDDPPFRNPVFVLTHHARDRVEFENGTTFNFVTGGFEAALDQAEAAAGERDVLIAGGAETIQQYLAAGLIDEFEIHVAPMLLGSGTPLFGGAAAERPPVELTRVLSSPGAAHLRYRVVT
ncbi:MAG: dihydrofolate reductase family protein [Gaiellaceae bacterium]